MDALLPDGDEGTARTWAASAGLRFEVKPKITYQGERLAATVALQGSVPWQIHSWVFQAPGPCVFAVIGGLLGGLPIVLYGGLLCLAVTAGAIMVARREGRDGALVLP